MPFSSLSCCGAHVHTCIGTQGPTLELITAEICTGNCASVKRADFILEFMSRLAAPCLSLTDKELHNFKPKGSN